MSHPLVPSAISVCRFFQSSTVLLLTALLMACGGSRLPEPPQERLTAVVDAGSSGSRIFLYRSVPDDSFIQIEELFTSRDAPHGLSWYDGTRGPESAPGNAGAAGIQPLLSGLQGYMANKGIPKNKVSISVLATAGMRLVDAETSSAIYQSIRRTINDNGFEFRQVSTISGQTEGIYSWADVNYLGGNFKSGRSTQGIVEVGGASAQVAFATTSVNDPNVVIQNVNSVSYPVFSVSYLGLGQAQARLAMLNDDSSNGQGGRICYPNNATGSPDTYDTDTAYTGVRGIDSSYTTTCRRTYESIITRVAGNAINNYPVTNISLLGNFASTRFVGVSAVYNVLQDWGAVNAIDPQSALNQTVNTTCAGANAWPRVLMQFKGVASVFAQNGCANAAYIDAFVYGAQSLNISPARLTGVATIDGRDLTWTRGFVILDNKY